MVGVGFGPSNLALAAAGAEHDDQRPGASPRLRDAAPAAVKEMILGYYADTNYSVVDAGRRRQVLGADLVAYATGTG